MISYQGMVEQWGEDGLLYLPLERFGDHIGFPADRLPPEAAMPAEVPILFTAYVSGQVELFNVLEIQLGDGEPVGMIVLGAVPDDEQLVYCLNGDTGQVLMIDLNTPSIELVNSSFRAFVEFLFRMDRFIRADQGKATRAIPAARLRGELAELDPAAFEDPESWWSAALAQLEGAI